MMYLHVQIWCPGVWKWWKTLEIWGPRWLQTMVQIGLNCRYNFDGFEGTNWVELQVQIWWIWNHKLRAFGCSFRCKWAANFMKLDPQIVVIWCAKDRKCMSQNTRRGQILVHFLATKKWTPRNANVQNWLKPESQRHEKPKQHQNGRNRQGRPFRAMILLCCTFSRAHNCKKAINVKLLVKKSSKYGPKNCLIGASREHLFQGQIVFALAPIRSTRSARVLVGQKATARDKRRCLAAKSALPLFEAH